MAAFPAHPAIEDDAGNLTALPGTGAVPEKIALPVGLPDCHFAEHQCPQNCVLMPPEMPPIVVDAYGNIETNAERYLAQNG
jgi:hypothetical protein